MFAFSAFGHMFIEEGKLVESPFTLVALISSLIVSRVPRHMTLHQVVMIGESFVAQLTLPHIRVLVVLGMFVHNVQVLFVATAH